MLSIAYDEAPLELLILVEHTDSSLVTLGACVQHKVLLAEDGPGSPQVWLGPGCVYRQRQT